MRDIISVLSSGEKPPISVIPFILVATLMLLVALAFVLVPLFRKRTDVSVADSIKLSDAAGNVAVFRSAKREIEDEHARGVISAEERDSALNELSQRLVDEVPEVPEVPAVPGVHTTNVPTLTKSRRAPWWLMGVLGALIPLAAISIYATLGSPQALNGVATAIAAAPHAPDGAAPGNAAPISDKQILAMVDTLAEKMRQNPADPKGWVLLARSQGALGRFPESLAAYERATQLLPNDAQLLADYADVAVMSQDGRFDGKPVLLIAQALKLDPTNMKALALAATADMRLGNRDGALKKWQKLKSLVVKDSEDYRQVESIIAEINTGKSAMASNAAGAPDTSNASPAPAKPAASNTPVASAKPSSAASGSSVSGQVLIAPEITAKLAPTDTLFVYARAKEGPRMPLAILRIPAPKAGEFPKAFELTDAMAMAPGMNLSSFPDVVIEARISKSGNAQLQPGDLSGVSEPVKPGARAIKVTISKVAP